MNYGKVSCGWKRSSEGLEFEVTIPANCRALVRLPDGSEQEQAAGERRYFIAQ
ncbi:MULTISPECIES: alpha-L-rhamnosidase C-terminal domain-containing protein [Bacillota]|uniref:alpha-L-rhamnosidase C-terminal domain-containing protein n=1 Tax=Bacillota TaxID=1239 RepID=UPI0039778B5D